MTNTLTPLASDLACIQRRPFQALSRVDENCYDTRLRSQRWVHEAAWNCESQHPIGKLAWRCSKYKEETRWENITVADITPRGAFLPPNIASRPPYATGVDFGIVLESSPSLDTALPHLEPLQGTGYPSCNPTTLSSVAYNPLVAVVETKRKGADIQNAEYQIGIWASAMFRRIYKKRWFRNPTNTTKAIDGKSILLHRIKTVPR